MPDLTPEEQALWNQHQPGKRIPGSPEPIEGRCAAKLNGQNKGLRDLNIKTLRYCTLTKGAQTDHEGYGNCKYHLGSTTKQELEAVKVQVLTLAEKRRAVMENPPAIRDWTIELDIMAREMKAWMVVAREELLKRPGLFTTTQTGEEKEIALITTYREAVRDFNEILKHVAKMDLKERQLQLKLNHVRAIAAVVKKVVLDSSLGLDDEQSARVMAILSGEMKKITPLLLEDFDYDTEEVDEDEEN